MSFILDMDIILELCSVRLSVPYNWPKLANWYAATFSLKEKKSTKPLLCKRVFARLCPEETEEPSMSYRVVLDLPHVGIQCTLTL